MRKNIRKIAFVMLFSLALYGCDSNNLDFSHQYSAGASLFELPNGVNEFELIYVDGYYYFYRHRFNELKTYVRRARTLDGLASAPGYYVLPGLYPTAIFDNGVWHAWVYDGARTVHYTASAWNGPYTKRDTIDFYAASDWQVRKNPSDGWYYASYKDGKSEQAYIARAISPDGPWQKLTEVFSPDQREAWYSAEQADPAIFFDNGKAYMTFAGWGGGSVRVNDGQQVVGVVELDPHTFKAAKPAKMLVAPTEDWQKRGGGRKVFNPVFIRTSRSGPLLVYAVNPSSDGVRAGWGYVKLDSK
jgi:GH43 family beta-xylosidase